MRALSVGPLFVVLAVACSAPPPPRRMEAAAASAGPPAPAAPPAPPPPVGRATTLLLVGSDEPRSVAWTASGDVVALSEGRLWRLRPGDDAARITPLPPGRAQLAVARRADVVVVTSGSRGSVFREGKKTLDFEVDALAGGVVSDDGRVFAARRSGNARGAAPASHVIDLATGAKVAAIPATFELSSDGAFAITAGGVYRTKDGAEVARLARVTASTGRGFAAGKAAIWQDDALVTYDTATGATKEIPASCGEDRRRADAVDVAARHAFRVCRNKLFIVDLATLAVRTAPTKGSGPASELPSLAVSEDGASVVLDGGKTSEVFDLSTGAARPSKARPPLRGAAGEVPLEHDKVGRPSPDGKLLLVSRFDRDGLTLIERATGREIARWGMPILPPARSDLAVFAHDRALVVLADMGAPSGPQVTRIGQAATTRPAFPRIRPEPPCPSGEPFRSISATEVFYTWAPYRGQCVCTASGCSKSNLDWGLFARLRSRSLVAPAQGNAIEGAGLALVEGKGPPKNLPVEANVYAASFGDDEGRTAVVVWRAERGERYEAREIALDEMSVTRKLELPDRGGHSFQVFVTPGHLVAAQATSTHATVSIQPRTGGEPSEVLAWPGSAIVRAPDGRIELVGDAAAGAVACVEPDGTLRSFAACGDRFAAVGHLVLD